MKAIKLTAPSLTLTSGYTGRVLRRGLILQLGRHQGTSVSSLRSRGWGTSQNSVGTWFGWSDRREPSWLLLYLYSISGVHVWCDCPRHNWKWGQCDEGQGGSGSPWRDNKATLQRHEPVILLIYVQDALWSVWTTTLKQRCVLVRSSLPNKRHSFSVLCAWHFHGSCNLVTQQTKMVREFSQAIWFSPG